jgi:hypothetical protein
MHPVGHGLATRRSPLHHATFHDHARSAHRHAPCGRHGDRVVGHESFLPRGYDRDNPHHVTSGPHASRTSGRRDRPRTILDARRRAPHHDRFLKRGAARHDRSRSAARHRNDGCPSRHHCAGRLHLRQSARPRHRQSARPHHRQSARLHLQRNVRLRHRRNDHPRPRDAPTPPCPAMDAHPAARTLFRSHRSASGRRDTGSLPSAPEHDHRDADVGRPGLAARHDRRESNRFRHHGPRASSRSFRHDRRASNCFSRRRASSRLSPHDRRESNRFSHHAHRASRRFHYLLRPKDAERADRSRNDRHHVDETGRRSGRLDRIGAHRRDRLVPSCEVLSLGSLCCCVKWRVATRVGWPLA